MRFDAGIIYPREDGYHAITLRKGTGTALKGFPNLALDLPNLVMNGPAPNEDSANRDRGKPRGLLPSHTTVHTGPYTAVRWN